ncbi:MAG: glycosyltransferase family 9 protein [Gammaproteobacteria bacterium]
MKHPIEIPKTICLLRLSAIGDVLHALPVVRTIQDTWPDTAITWIIGKVEYSLVRDVQGIEFIVFDKSKGFSAQKDIFKKLKHRKFDVLMLMQYSLRAHIVSLAVKAGVRLGYDNARSKDLHRYFVNKKIPANNQHVMDSFFSFIETLGINKKLLKWDIPISDEDDNFATNICNNKPTLLISPCSSHLIRSWNVNGYAEIADYAVEKYDMQVLLTGSRKKEEIKMATDIQQTMKSTAINLAGKTNLKQLLALVSHSKAVLTPDSGPGHMATATGIPAIGLYAATNPARARPYLSEQWCVDKYDEVAHKFLQKSATEIKWGTKIESEGAMDLIQVSDVMNKLDKVMSIEN